MAATATLGGLASELGGEKFANGVVTAAFALLFNDMLHQYRIRRTLRLRQIAYSPIDITVGFRMMSNNIKVGVLGTHDPNKNTIKIDAFATSMKNADVISGLEMEIEYHNSAGLHSGTFYFSKNLSKTAQLFDEGFEYIGETHAIIYGVRDMSSIKVTLNPGWTEFQPGGAFVPGYLFIPTQYFSRKSYKIK